MRNPRTPHPALRTYVRTYEAHGVLPMTLTLPELTALEAQVRHSMAGFPAAGEALARIRAGCGHRLRGYATFDGYCRDILSLSARHAQRLLRGADTAARVRTALGLVPRNEAVARALTPIAEDVGQLRRVQTQLEAAGSSLATATAAVVARAVATVAPLEGLCPQCAQLPAAYMQTAGAWHCSACGSAVNIRVWPTSIARNAHVR